MEGMDAAKGIMASLAFGWIFGGLLSIFYGRPQAIIYNAIFFAFFSAVARLIFIFVLFMLNVIFIL